METKAAVQFGALSLSLEGSEAFVSQQLDRFSDLIVKHAGELASPEDAPAAADVVEAAPPGKQRKARSAGSGGTGCNSKVRAMLAEGFFSVPRSTKDVVEKLREQATPYASNRVSAALIALARGRHLRRHQEGGDWLYLVP